MGISPETDKYIKGDGDVNKILIKVDKMIRRNYTKKRKYDDELIFDAYMRAGSMNATIDMLFENGYTGKKLFMSVISMNVARYVVWHPEEARKKMIAVGFMGAVDDRMWTTYLVRKAKTFFKYSDSIPKYYLWLEMNNLLEFAIKNRLASDNPNMKYISKK